MARRQDLLVVRELAVDEARHEVDALEVEQDLVAGLGQHELDGVVGVREDPAELAQRPRRDDDRRGFDGIEHIDRPDGDPVVVGSGEGEPTAFELGQDAGEDRPGFVACSREHNLLQGLLEHLLRYARRGALAGGLDRRKLVRVDPLDVCSEPAAAQVQRVQPLQLEVNLLRGGQAPNEVGQQAGRHSRRAVRLDLARHPVGDADLEVRRGQLEAGVLGPEKDIREHGQGASTGDRPGHHGQTARQVLLHDRELHVGLSPSCADVRRGGASPDVPV